MPVRVLEVPYQVAKGALDNPLLNPYGKTPFDNNAKESLVEVNSTAGYTIDFKTEKGKQYTVVPK